MSLSEKIAEDMKNAMKQQQSATLSTLRLLRSALKNKQIDLMHELSDTEVEDVIRAQVKQLKDGITSYEAVGRTDMVESAQAELVVLQAYLPKELSDVELEGIVKEAVTNSGATSKAEMGKVMGFVMKAVAGRADGTRVKVLVEKILSVFVLAIALGVIAIPVHASIGFGATSSTDSFFSASLIETGLRVLRVVILWSGLYFVNEILHGGFQFVVGSSRNAEHDGAMQKITSGFFGTAVIALSFSVVTVIIQRIS